MLFNSFEFLLFFPTVVLLYYFIPVKFRWLFLLISSYYFYMNWKPVYAFLIFFSTIITWTAGILISQNKNKRLKKTVLVGSLVINLSILFTYKYLGFINDNLNELINFFNLRMEIPDFDILLPVGISFYTFQSVGYTLDIYRGDLKPEKHLGVYALFVSFFPQLVAGPIERAKNLLPQFHETKKFKIENFKTGMYLIIWGYFMKVVISDRIGMYVDATYNNLDLHNGTTLLISTIFFSFQIYCDFAGYSSIAIGAAKIMGFNLMTNFRRPYFSVNISEFWSRWHISLSTWFRDYLYIPLGGNRVSKPREYFNLFLTFLISGLWHGANWTFIIWGGLHGLFNSLQKFFKIDKLSFRKISYQKFLFFALNFTLVIFAWIFFRANSVADAFTIITKIFSQPGDIYIGSISTLMYGVFGLSILLFKEIREEFFPNRMKLLQSKNDVISSFSLSVLVVIILSIGVFNGGQFIYFQF
ncbi:MAG: membrane-bound O-acyltransferase family protein [Fluviicola sp.]|nr:MAG: membrane-bound O-acyltransferase family protein [Fluviicola sp.]